MYLVLITQCNEDSEKILVLWRKLKGKGTFANDEGYIIFPGEKVKRWTWIRVRLNFFF